MTEEEKVSRSPGISLPPHLPDTRYYHLPGREQDLNRLLAELREPQGPPIIALYGQRGMGKTTLAVELARRALRQGLFEGVVGESAQQEVFPGGEIIWAEETSLDFEFLLDSIARQLDRWDIPVMQAEKKLAALVSLLKEHRYLVMIDNLETFENANAIVGQLRNLLGTSRAIITSRMRVAHDFVYLYSLAGLSIEDALVFLQREAEQQAALPLQHAPREQLVEIFQTTGGAPLAMKLVAAQSRFLDLDIILRRLQHSGHELYAYIFRQSWGELSLTAQLILIYIGRTVMTTVSLEELASVGIAEDEVQLREAIEQLVVLSLLEVSSTAGQTRYGIHLLTRWFVNAELPVLWQEQGPP